MQIWMKAASVGGSILVLIALAIALLKGLIALVGFVTGAIKIVIFLVFITVFCIVGYLAFKTWNDNRKN